MTSAETATAPTVAKEPNQPPVKTIEAIIGVLGMLSDGGLRPRDKARRCNTPSGGVWAVALIICKFH